MEKYSFTTDPMRDSIEETGKKIVTSIEDNSARINEELKQQKQVLSEIRSQYPEKRPSKNKIIQILRTLTKLEVLGVIIALLQLVIAFPQLKWAYESATDNSNTEIKVAMEELVKNTGELKMVNIPDSLMTPKIIELRSMQQSILYNMKLLAQSKNFMNNFKNESISEEDLLMGLRNIGQIAKRLRDDASNTIKEVELVDSIVVKPTYEPIKNPQNPAKKDSAKIDKDANFILRLYSPTEELTQQQAIDTAINNKLYNIYEGLKKNKNYDVRNNLPLDEYADLIKPLTKMGVNSFNALNQLQIYLTYGRIWYPEDFYE